MLRSKHRHRPSDQSTIATVSLSANPKEEAESPAGEGLIARLDQLQVILLEIQARLTTVLLPEKEAFTPGEFAEATGLSTYTVQDHCRRGRLQATKALSGRGGERGWRISLDELKRYQREGLLPEQTSREARPALPTSAEVRS